MKNLIKKSWVILLIGVMACTDLNLVPKGRASSEILLTTPEGYQKLLAKLYLGLANTGQNGPAGAPDIATGDEGFSQYIRALWNAETMPTDEAVTLWGDPNLKDYHAHNWTSQSAFLTQFYYRIFYQIALANQFLREISDANLTKRGLPTTFINTTAKVYRAEARLLRALSYWHGLNYFRNIPFTDENSGTGAPKQATPQEIFNFIESEIKAIETILLPAKTNVYGRFDAAVAHTVLAKLYLNAEVYIGTAKYTECITYLNKVIPAGYSLAPVYLYNFLTDNNTSPEMIFGVPHDALRTPNFGGVTLIINGAVGGALASLPKVGGRNPIIGNDASWAGHRTTKALVNLFPDETGVIDSRALFYTNGQNKEINDINAFTDGYMVTKFRNVNKAGVPGSDPVFTDTDFPLFRLADIYLMYAEAVLRGGTGGSVAQAVTYMNQVRQRAYGANYGSGAGTPPGYLGMGVISATGGVGIAEIIGLDLILDERGREFYWEGHRRTDMVRFGVFTDNPTGNSRGLWPWKGNVKDGRTTESFRRIYPIPASDIIANQNLKQNTGY
ncbi:MAG: RagB/SusD family nutrient uptake outer membrane protein [Cytophagales bacterium]|nr:RagB/SusD family nutrient uptake outer membrane protein [Cytophagales bacterium]